jgi:hypothetical protein
MRRAIHVTEQGAVLACSDLAAQAAEVIRD